MGPSASWTSLVALVECSLTAQGHVSAPAKRLKDVLLVGHLEATVLRRADLEAKAGGAKDGKALATALRQLLKQDRVKAMARRQSVSDGAGAPATSTTAMQGKVYLLDGFPSSAEEASFLVPSGSSEQALDAVVQLRGGAHDEAYSAPQRTNSQASTAAKSMMTLSGSQSHSSLVGGSRLTASAATLPPMDVAPMFASSVVSGAEGTDANADAETAETAESQVLRESTVDSFLRGAQMDPNDLVSALKRARHEAPGPGWRDVLFLELDVVPRLASQNPGDFLPQALLATFVRLVGCAFAEKERFQAFVRTACTHVQVPKLRKPVNEALVEAYEAHKLGERRERSKVSRPSTSSVAAALCALFDVVVGECEREQRGARGELAGGGSEDGNREGDEEDEDEDDRDGDRDGDSTGPGQGHQGVLAFGDEAALQGHILGECLSSREHQVMAQSMRPAAPTGQTRAQEQARGLRKTQFREFHQLLEPARLEHLRTVEAFEGLLARADPREPAWAFEARTHMRTVRAPQLLSAALAQEPDVFSARLDESQALLLALHRHTPVSRQCTVTRSAFAHTSLRPTMSDWPAVLNLSGVNGVSGGVSGVGGSPWPCFFDVDAGPVQRLTHEVTLLFPCDDSVVRVEPHWCSVDLDGQRFGLRADGFFASFDDASGVLVSRGPQCPGKPDGLATIVSTYTAADGLRTTHCTDGTIRMQRDVQTAVTAPSTPSTLPSTECEGPECEGPEGAAATECEWESASRLVQSEGTVLVLDDEGRMTRVLYANGQVGLADGSTLEFSQGQCEVFTDPQTGASMLFREEDGTMLISHADADATTLALFRDGTRILKQRSTYRVEAPGFASIKVEAKVDAVAFRHARGASVNISQSGRQLRSTTLFADATVVQIEYDTRVTAKVNGMITTSKADGTVVEATDAGSVVLRPWDVDEGQRRMRRKAEAEAEARALDAEAREDPDRNVACYAFNVDDASMRVVDWEKNVFVVRDACNAKDEQAVQVDLAGAFGVVDAVVNTPLQPRLFRLRGDEIHEFLTAGQVAAHRARLAKRLRGTVHDLGDGSAVLSLGQALPQLQRSHAFVVPVLRQRELAASFARLLDQGPAGAASPGAPPPSPILLDVVQAVAPVEAAERALLREAETAFLGWQTQLAVQEGRFNVDDTRPHDAKAEERKIQASVAKDRRKMARAERKRLSKLARHAALGQPGTGQGSGVGDGIMNAAPSTVLEEEQCPEAPAPAEAVQQEEEQQGEWHGEEEKGAEEEEEEGKDQEAEARREADLEGVAAAQRPAKPLPRGSPLHKTLNYWNQE